MAQGAKDIGASANPAKLARAAEAYEDSSVWRLGYLLDLVGHPRQAQALDPFARKAKTAVLLDPAAKALIPALSVGPESVPKWKFKINEPVEIDS